MRTTSPTVAATTNAGDVGKLGIGVGWGRPQPAAPAAGTGTRARSGLSARGQVWLAAALTSLLAISCSREVEVTRETRSVNLDDLAATSSSSAADSSRRGDDRQSSQVTDDGETTSTQVLSETASDPLGDHTIDCGYGPETVSFTDSGAAGPLIHYKIDTLSEVADPGSPSMRSSVAVISCTAAARGSLGIDGESGHPTRTQVAVLFRPHSTSTPRLLDRNRRLVGETTTTGFVAESAVPEQSPSSSSGPETSSSSTTSMVSNGSTPSPRVASNTVNSEPGRESVTTAPEAPPSSSPTGWDAIQLPRALAMATQQLAVAAVPDADHQLEVSVLDPATQRVLRVLRYSSTFESASSDDTYSTAFDIVTTSGTPNLTLWPLGSPAAAAEDWLINTDFHNGPYPESATFLATEAIRYEAPLCAGDAHHVVSRDGLALFMDGPWAPGQPASGVITSVFIRGAAPGSPVEGDTNGQSAEVQSADRLFGSGAQLTPVAEMAAVNGFPLVSNGFQTITAQLGGNNTPRGWLVFDGAGPQIGIELPECGPDALVGL